MKIEVFGEAKPEEKVLRLKLVEMPEGVRLVAVDEYGRTVSAGNLLTINETGIKLNSSVSTFLGLPLDSRGAVFVAPGVV